MGLVEFLNKKLKAPIPSRFEDLYNYDYPALLEKSTFFEKEVRPNGLIRYKYDVTLDAPYLNAFDSLRIELCWAEKELKIDRVDYRVNLIFFSKRRILTKQQIAYVVDSIVWACRNDPNYEDVNKFDAIRFKEGSCKYMCPQLIPEINGSAPEEVAIRNDGSNGISVELAILYKDLIRLAKEYQSN